MTNQKFIDNLLPTHTKVTCPVLPKNLGGPYHRYENQMDYIVPSFVWEWRQRSQWLAVIHLHILYREYVQNLYQSKQDLT